MEVVKRWIRGFDELVSTDIDEHKANIKIKNAIKYIQENYATDLNMAVVSNYVSMNYSLFSFTFLSSLHINNHLCRSIPQR